VTDVHNPEQRSRNMAAIRSKNTKPELVVRKLLSEMGLRYRLHRSDLPGKPDIVMPGRKVVIFVHGCFFHVHRCKYGRVVPATNAEFWHAKRTGNVARDLRNKRQLRKLGWRVCTVWECETRSVAKMARKIQKFFVTKASANASPNLMRDPTTRIIYLDTNIWNRLFEQQVNPQKLLDDLRHRNATLAISGQTIYELGRTFLRQPQKGQDLFSYLKHYVDAGIVFVRDNMDQLDGEIEAVHNVSSYVIAFYKPDGDGYKALKTEVDKLAHGVFDEMAHQHISNREQFSKVTRADQKTHFEDKPEMKERLKSISDGEFPKWLDNESISNSGTAILTRHLLRAYTRLDANTAVHAAETLLNIKPSRISKGLVRADLYYNWRCARRESNPSDLIDDMYHVLNASYCDVYSTAEPGQGAYAALLLNGWTKVAIYDGSTPVDEWLLSLAGAGRAAAK
jgi:DNA mismatch endonuclease (patch repair protein)